MSNPVDSRLSLLCTPSWAALFVDRNLQISKSKSFASWLSISPCLEEHYFKQRTIGLLIHHLHCLQVCWIMNRSWCFLHLQVEAGSTAPANKGSDLKDTCQRSHEHMTFASMWALECLKSDIQQGLTQHEERRRRRRRRRTVTVLVVCISKQPQMAV